jgi:hypothetical protein
MQSQQCACCLLLQHLLLGTPVVHNSRHQPVCFSALPALLLLLLQPCIILIYAARETIKQLSASHLQQLLEQSWQLLTN